MPAGLARRPVISLDIRRLLLGCESWRFLRIKTYRDDFKLLAGIERDLSERSQHAIQNLIAKHRTRVINQRQNYGLTVKELAQGHFAALLIFKNRVQRYRLIQLLINTDFLQYRRQSH